MAGCVAFLPVRTDFANGGDEVPLFAPCRSCGCLAAVAFLDHDFGPSYFVSALFALTAGAIMYLSVSHIQNGSLYRKRDFFMIICVMLQVLLYLVSDFTHDYTRFQLYYAVDLALTLSMAALLPLTLREVKRA